MASWLLRSLLIRDGRVAGAGACSAELIAREHAQLATGTSVKGNLVLRGCGVKRRRRERSPAAWPSCRRSSRLAPCGGPALIDEWRLIWPIPELQSSKGMRHGRPAPGNVRQTRSATPPASGQTAAARCDWRPRPESNRGARICSPLRHHSATWPLRRDPYHGRIRRGNGDARPAWPVWATPLNSGPGTEVGGDSSGPL